MCQACENDVARSGDDVRYAKDIRRACREARKAGPPRWLMPVVPVSRMTAKQRDAALAQLQRRLPEPDGQGGYR